MMGGMFMMKITVLINIIIGAIHRWSLEWVHTALECTLLKCIWKKELAIVCSENGFPSSFSYLLELFLGLILKSMPKFSPLFWTLFSLFSISKYMASVFHIWLTWCFRMAPNHGTVPRDGWKQCLDGHFGFHLQLYLSLFIWFIFMVWLLPIFWLLRFYRKHKSNIDFILMILLTKSKVAPMTHLGLLGPESCSFSS